MEKQEPRKLKRSIGLWSAVAINVGAIIGGGIFVVTGIVAGYAGSALVISMIIAGVIAFITAWSFAKLTAWQPVEGGVYEYGRQLVSPYAGFLAGWMWIVANTFVGAAVSLGFAYYLTLAFPGLPTGIVAAVLCLLFTALNLVGAKESASINNLLVAVKLAVLAFFVAFGVLYVNSGNFVPFAPISSGVLYGSFFIFFAYGGFARVSVIAEEVKDAKRNVPRALLLSLGISIVVYVLVGLVAVGLLGPEGLAASPSPLSAAIGFTGQFVGCSNRVHWRFSGNCKRFADGDFGSFTDGLFHGATQRFTLCISSFAPQVLDTLLLDSRHGGFNGCFGFVCRFEKRSGS